MIYSGEITELSGQYVRVKFTAAFNGAKFEMINDVLGTLYTGKIYHTREKAEKAINDNKKAPLQ